MARLKSGANAASNEPIGRTQRRVEIAVILVQNGWDALVRQLGLLDIIPGGWRKKLKLKSVMADEDDLAPPPLPVPKALRKTLEDLGPTFIKLGQILSTRADLLPEEYIDELKKLQQEVQADPWPHMERVLLDEWNLKQLLMHQEKPATFKPALSVNEIFDEFDTVPIATGSLGQAYRAQLTVANQRKPKDVIVKIQRPGIVPVVEADIAILKDLASFAERTKWGKIYNFMDMVNEFAMVIRNEMDFSQEAYNTQTIGNSLAKSYPDEVTTAQVYWEYCNPRMMTMEYLAGDNISLLFPTRAESQLQQDQQAEPPTPLDLERKRIAKTITNVFLHQIFIDGFFHADPHPGNLLIELDKETKKIQLVLLDFGMVGRVDPRSRSILIDFLLAIIRFDAPRATERIMEFGKAPPDIDRFQFSQDLDHVLRSSLGKPLREIKVGKILQDILDMTMRYRVQLPAIFITLLRVLIATEGICRQLDREYILIKAAEPFVIQAIRSQFLQNFTIRDLARLGLELTNTTLALPRHVDDLLRNVNNGKLEFVYKHRQLEPVVQGLHVVGNRVAAGLLVAGLTIASAISLTISTGPRLLGIPLASLSLFTLSTLLGLWLLNKMNE